MCVQRKEKVSTCEGCLSCFIYILSYLLSTPLNSCFPNNWNVTADCELFHWTVKSCPQQISLLKKYYPRHSDGLTFLCQITSLTSHSIWIPSFTGCHFQKNWWSSAVWRFLWVYFKRTLEVCNRKDVFFCDWKTWK